MSNIKFKVFILVFCAFALKISAQQVTYINDFINWEIVADNSQANTKTFITFDKATHGNVASGLPQYTHILKHNYNADVKIEFNSLQYNDLTAEEAALINAPNIPYDIEVETHPIIVNKKHATSVAFTPFVKDPATGAIKKVIFFSLKVTLNPILGGTTDATYNWADNSVLEKGDWIRIKVALNGVYKIDVNFLEEAGISANGADISAVRLYGNGGGMLPQVNSQTNSDDLIENPIEVKDLNQNGKFDGNDYFIFYAEGANKWEFDEATSTFKHRTHRYSNENNYFITIGQTGGKRISTQASENGTPDTFSSTFDQLYVYEKDEINFLKSGRDWYGEEFGRQLSYDFGPINFPDRVTSEPVKIRSQAVARSAENCKFTISNNGTPVLEHPIDGIIFSYESNYIDTPDTATGTFISPTNDLNIRYTFQRLAPSYKGWLNYFELAMRRQMKFNGGQVAFRDSRNIGTNNLTEFRFDANGQSISIWEITTPTDAKKQQTNVNGNTHTFRLNTPSLREFIAFSENTLLVPDVKLAERVENQNIHAIKNVDMVIVAHPLFVSEAERLAKHHEDYDNLKVAVVTPQQVYNEFSAGKQDVTAIRNFMKMLYDRPSTTGNDIKYLLLFGDASYDYKDLNDNNTNYVPTYQSRNTYDPVYSYCSDDYFGILDDNEGLWSESISVETVDIGIGRFPVQTEEQARHMVDKVIAYTQPEAFGNWRNGVCFIADDEDSNLHFIDAESFSFILENNHKNYNIDKIYLDGFKQVSVGSGTRYPEVNEQINRKVENGALIINYTGHGGELGLAAEQIIDIPMINAWNNSTNLPLFITATCEFSRFDDPGRTSGGEFVLLNPNGGSIALLTTVRLVYAWPNKGLNTSIYNHIFKPLPSGEMPRLGDINRIAKNENLNRNTRNFTLLGDPAVRLAYPEHTVVTTEINGVDVTQTTTTPDTIGALAKVTIKGHVADAGGNKLSNFNGIVYPTVFDKEVQLSTLANDPTSKKSPYSMFKNIIYNGKASVKDGDFEYSFIVPKDISYSLGNSKISYYATDNKTDAHGFYDSVIIAGTDANAPNDVTGPTVRLFMNDTTFRFGGITDENPTLLALVSDLHGISTTGTGIGRDITAVLDGDRKNLFILNDYYEAKLNSYQDGEIRYPLKNLSEGHHNIKVKVWDVYNNSAEGYTEFLVAKSEKLAIKSLINYPNPFSTRTKFLFEHNKQGEELTIDVDIYSTDGKLIKSLNTFVPAADATFDGLEWNVESDYGNNIAQGIYLFRIKVRSGNDTVEETQKMVLIK